MQRVFHHVSETSSRLAFERHGLYPRWIYESRAREIPTIRRHLPFYELSTDRDRYRRLKHRLSLYRLAFGQANQDDLLDELEKKADPKSLAPFMLNLGPFRDEVEWPRALREAQRRLRSPAAHSWLVNLCEECDSKLQESTTRLSAAGQRACRKVLSFVRARIGVVRLDRLTKQAVAALAYFRNPFDAWHDDDHRFGLKDDERHLVDTERRIASRGVRAARLHQLS
jgi:hypothetical protein